MIHTDDKTLMTKSQICTSGKIQVLARFTPYLYNILDRKGIALMLPGTSIENSLDGLVPEILIYGSISNTVLKLCQFFLSSPFFNSQNPLHGYADTYELERTPFLKAVKSSVKG